MMGHAAGSDDACRVCGPRPTCSPGLASLRALVLSGVLLLGCSALDEDDDEREAEATAPDAASVDEDDASQTDSELGEGNDEGASQTDSGTDAMHVRSRDEFASVATDFSGGFCEMGCPGKLVREVQASGVLVLEDDQGLERFELSAEDYEKILTIVLDPAFDRALQDPSDCHQVPDANARVSVTWSDTGVQTDGAAASCINGRNASEHIYNRLTWALIDLQKEYLDCTSSTPRPDAPGRRLCDVCNIESCTL